MLKNLLLISLMCWGGIALASPPEKMVVTSGKSLGAVGLGMEREKVHLLWGPPLAKGLFQKQSCESFAKVAIAVIYKNDLVEEIITTRLTDATNQGTSLKLGWEKLLRRLPFATKKVYETGYEVEGHGTVLVGHVEQIIESNRGISIGATCHYISIGATCHYISPDQGTSDLIPFVLIVHNAHKTPIGLEAYEYETRKIDIPPHLIFN